MYPIILGKVHSTIDGFNNQIVNRITRKSGRAPLARQPLQVVVNLARALLARPFEVGILRIFSRTVESGPPKVATKLCKDKTMQGRYIKLCGVSALSET